MNIIDLFSQGSDRYAAARPRYPQELYQFLSSVANQHDRVWDCGAGNGQAAIGLAEFFREVLATDVSEQQIAHALPSEKVQYSVQPAEATNFPNHFFDMVVVAQALHWFDFDRFWLEVKRVLKPEGIFAVWGYDWFAIEPDIDRIIQDDVRGVIHPFWSPRLQYLWNGYQDIHFPFEPIETPVMKMQVNWQLANLLDYISTWSGIRKCIEHQGQGFLEIANDKLTKAWGDPLQLKTATMRFHLVVGRNNRGTE